MKIKLVLPLLAALVVPFLLALPTYAHTSQAGQSKQSTPGCAPIVFIGLNHLNFLVDAIHLDVSPCALVALQHGNAIALQSDGTIPDSAIQTVAPIIQQGLTWRTNDMLTTQQSCPGSFVTLSSPILSIPLIGPATYLVDLEAFVRNVLPRFNLGPIPTNAPFLCQ